MRYLSLLLLTFSLILCSCSKNEPSLEINLPISETYVPCSIEFNTNDIDEEQKHNIIHLVNNQHIVNSADELPNDPIGFSEAYGKINFEKRTLLIKYMLHDYSIDTYNNRYFRNTKENTYNWMVNIGSASNLDDDSDNLMLTRFAILVNKLPADADFKSWFGLSHIGWFPEK